MSVGDVIMHIITFPLFIIFFIAAVIVWLWTTFVRILLFLLHMIGFWKQKDLKRRKTFQRKLSWIIDHFTFNVDTFKRAVGIK